MDNHFHLICQGDNLAKIIKEIKSYTAREIIKLAEQDHKTWLLNQLSFYRLKHKVGSAHQVWQEGIIRSKSVQKRCCARNGLPAP